MTKILAITNQKGGVGKTTTAVNLAASLGQAGKRVLLVDIDPQGNATVGSGIDMYALESTVYEVLLGDEALADVVVESEAGYSLLPSHPDLAGAQVEMTELPDRDFRLRNALVPIAEEYDYILIDCPPSLNVLTVNALVAASGVLIPVQCEYYALEGLSGLVDTIAKVRQVHNPTLQIAGLIRTMFDGRNRLANEVSEQLREHFGERLFRSVIPRNVRLAEAPGYGKSVLDYDRHCAGSQAYLALAGEVLRRV